MTDAWTYTVGMLPHKVTAYENLQRQGALYLRWRKGGNWAVKSLQRKLRSENGRILKATEAWAIEQAQKQHGVLLHGLPLAQRPVAPLTLGEGLAKAIHPDTGKYPGDTLHRREVIRSIGHAERILGPHTLWNAITKADIRRLWRIRYRELVADGQVGVRGAEVTVRDLLAVAAWLRDEDLVGAGACVAEKDWKEKLRAEAGSPEPHRPRHTIEEMRAIIAAAPRVDPRFGLLMALGAELRLGQVLRAYRSDLKLDANTFTIRRKGKKGGVTVLLTPGQRRAVDAALQGYLAELEARAMDYPLFPAGKLEGWLAVGGTVEDGKRTGHRLEVGPDGLRATAVHADAGALDRSVIDGWFREAEQLAGVPHLERRGAYGLRRVAVDFVMDAGISEDALKEHGGWSDKQVPETIYRGKEREKAQREAAESRARLRGESE